MVEGCEQILKLLQQPCALVKHLQQRSYPDYVKICFQSDQVHLSEVTLAGLVYLSNRFAYVCLQ
jgi:hypothetical protein